MLIELINLPSSVTRDDIDELCQHSALIKSIHIVKNNHSDKTFAMIDINCDKRVSINAICGVLNNKFMNGHHIMAYPSLYS